MNAWQCVTSVYLWGNITLSLVNAIVSLASYGIISKLPFLTYAHGYEFS